MHLNQLSYTLEAITTDTLVTTMAVLKSSILIDTTLIVEMISLTTSKVMEISVISTVA
jgi:hypothetical protein